MAILSLIFELIWWVILLNIIITWLISFEVLNTQQPMVQQIHSFLRRLTEPVYRQVRKVIPVVNGLDFSPVVVLVLLMIVRRAIGA